MGKVYLKTLGEILAKKAGPKVLGVGGKVVGRVIAVGAAAWTAYDFLNNLNKNIKNEPDFQRMIQYQGELEKWGSAISCIGRNQYIEGAFGSLNEGGCINALSEKKSLNSNSKFSSGQDIRPPDTELAKELLERAADYISQTENIWNDKQFKGHRDSLVEKLKELNNKIDNEYQICTNYSHIQQELSEIVKSIKSIEVKYGSAIYKCKDKIQKTMPGNVGWAFASAFSLGFIKKKTKPKIPE